MKVVATIALVSVAVWYAAVSFIYWSITWPVQVTAEARTNSIAVLAFCVAVVLVCAFIIALHDSE